MMNIQHPQLLFEVEAFLSETGMGVSYFGKAATGNSEVIPRIREGRPVLPQTERNIREFMARRRAGERFRRAPKREAAE